MKTRLIGGVGWIEGVEVIMMKTQCRLEDWRYQRNMEQSHSLRSQDGSERRGSQASGCAVLQVCE